MTNSATKNAIVTGASGGIGGSIAKRLAKDGFSVVVTTRENRPQQKQLSQISRLQADGPSLCKRMWQIPKT